MYTCGEFFFICLFTWWLYQKWILLSIFECHCCHSLIFKWIFKERPAFVDTVSRRSSSSLIVKLNRKNQLLCLIITFDQRHIDVQISCANIHYTNNHWLSIRCHEKCAWLMIDCFSLDSFSFFEFNFDFSIVEMTWRKIKKKKKTTTAHFVIMVMATAVYSTWIFN